MNPAAEGAPGGSDRPLWPTLALLVAVACTAHLLVTGLVVTGRIPAVLRTVSFCAWGVAVVGFLGFNAWPRASARQPRPVGLARFAWLLVPLGYLLLSLPFFLPVFPHLGREILGDRDSFQALWNPWWIARAAATGHTVLFTDMVWAPVGAPTIFHTLAPAPSLGMLALRPFLGEVPAYNTIILAAFPLAGGATYLLLRSMGVDRRASFVAGLVFAWCPFLTTKLKWIGSAHSGVLVLFALALVRALPLSGADPGRRAQALLALAALWVQFTDSTLAVFAANLGLVRLGAGMVHRRALRAPMRQFWRACLPALIVLLPYLGVATYFAFAYAIPVRRTSLTVVPEPLHYLLPLASGSAYSFPLAHLLGPFNRGMISADFACYLGVLVLPLALAGWYLERRRPEVRFWAGTFLLFLVLSLGPRLLSDRVPIRIFDRPIPLPFALWRHLPGVGLVGQSGRYLVLGYLAMAVGVGMLLFHLRGRIGRRLWSGVAVGTVAAIALDFAFVPSTVPLPEAPPLADRAGRVMEVRIYRGETMYYQTRHNRALVGGYLSRPLPRARAVYRGDPCITWLMYDRPGDRCPPGQLVPALAQLDVTDVFMDPGDRRGEWLGQQGLTLSFRDRISEVWSVPVGGGEVTTRK